MAFGTEVTLPMIRRYARRIAEQFHPDKIILFGSHAYGTPHESSDVDLLVVMPMKNQHSQSLKIRWKLPPPFAMDLLAYSPEYLDKRLLWGDSFVREITTLGKVLYEKSDEGVGGESGKRSHGSKNNTRRKSSAV